MRVGSPCSASLLATSGCCSDSAWWGCWHGDGMRHRNGRQHNAGCPAARGWERPAGGTHVPADGQDPLGAAGFYCHRGFHVCCSCSCQAFPSLWVTGTGAHCFSESITHLVMGEQRLSIVQEKCPCRPWRGKGGLPRVPRHYRQGCPLVMVFHHGACCQKETAPVFPTGTLALVPS